MINRLKFIINICSVHLYGMSKVLKKSKNQVKKM